MTLYLTLASCAFLAGWLVYRYDMYEREPWYMVLLAVALGALAMWGIGFIEEATLRLIVERPTPAAMAFVASTHEEGVRLVLVLAIALLIPGQFNDPMDGIIYGSLVGLGMAIIESVDYLNRARPPETLPPTEVIRLLGHLIMGGITGFAAGMFRMRMPRWFPALVGCVAFSTMLHFLWDVIALESRRLPVVPGWMRAAGVVLMLGGMAFFGFLVVLASEWSRLVFAPHAAHRLWGWPFTLLMKRPHGGGPPGD